MFRYVGLSGNNIRDSQLGVVEFESLFVTLHFGRLGRNGSHVQVGVLQVDERLLGDDKRAVRVQVHVWRVKVEPSRRVDACSVSIAEAGQDGVVVLGEVDEERGRAVQRRQEVGQVGDRLKPAWPRPVLWTELERKF